MTIKEFGVLAKALQTYYPKDNLLPSDEAKALWYEQLKDLDYNILSNCLVKWVATNKWSPTIADIRELATGADSLPESPDAWEEVKQAIAKYGHWDVKAALDSLSPLTRKTVEKIGFYELCASENEIADRAHFMQMYNIIAEREKKERQIPPEVRLKLEKLWNSQPVNQIEGV